MLHLALCEERSDEAICLSGGEMNPSPVSHYVGPRPKGKISVPADGCTSSVGTPHVPLRTVITRVPGLRPVRTSETSTPA